MQNVVAPPKPRMVKKEKSIYERLGGKKSIIAAVNMFYDRVLRDPSLRPFFAKTNIDWLKTRQVQFFTQALGGPAIYKGPDMRSAHEHLPIEKRHFDRVAGHLVDTLKALKVPQSLIEEVIGAIAPLSDDIINTPTPSAG